MSTLRTYNLQNPDSASVNIELTSDGGAVAAGILTSVGGLNVGTGGTVITTTAGGRIGIGTISPNSLLELSTNATSAAGGVTVNNTNAAGYSTLQLKNSGASGKTYTVSVGGNTSGLANEFYVYDDTAAAKRFSIDSSGRVTMPYQPLAVVGKVTSQTGFGDIVFEQVWHNVGSHYNNSTGVFNCPVAGYYYTHIMVMSNGTDHTMDINLHVNGSGTNQLVPYQAATGGIYNQVSGSTIIYCAANDNLRYSLNNGSIYGTTSGRHSSAIFHLVG